MPIISEITYKNNLSDFIDYETIKSEVDYVRDIIKQAEDNSLEVLKKELTNGGLDLYAININGAPIFHMKASDIYNEISVVLAECKTAIDNIDSKAKQHRTDELNRYVEALEARIEELENDIAENRKLAEQYLNEWKNTPGRGKTPEGSNAYNKYYSYNSEANNMQDELDGGWLSAHHGGLYSKYKEATAAQKQMES